MLYRFLKILVSIGIRFYYKEVKILHKQFLAPNGKEPLIIIANHPNTLMDAMMLGFVCGQPIHFMAKGTLFNSRFKLWLLQKFNMIPINRQGEGKIKGVSNQDSFAACYKLLEQGKTLVIFPEGSSFLERHLRELKSGTARIALDAELKNSGNLKLKIVPVGLNYLQAEKFRSSVLVNVGKKISVNEYLEDYKKDGGKTAKRLTEKFRVNLERLLVNSDSKEHEEIVDDLAEMLSSKYLRTKENGVEEEVLFLKKIRDKIDEIQLTHPWKIEEIRLIVKEIQQLLSNFNIRPDFLDRRFRLRMFFRQMLFSVFLIIIGLPIFLLGCVFNIIQFKLTDIVVPKLTKEIEYVAPLSVLLGLILYPVFYSTMYLVANHYLIFSDLEKVILFSSMPISGLLAYSYYRYVVHVSSKWNYIFHMIYHRKSMIEIKEKREVLRKIIID